MACLVGEPTGKAPRLIGVVENAQPLKPERTGRVSSDSTLEITYGEQK